MLATSYEFVLNFLHAHPVLFWTSLTAVVYIFMYAYGSIENHNGRKLRKR